MVRHPFNLLVQVLDSNNDGFISKAEFGKMARNLSFDQVKDLQNCFDMKNLDIHVQVEAVVAKFDSDGDGKLDYEEFKSLMQKKKTK